MLVERINEIVKLIIITEIIIKIPGSTNQENIRGEISARIDTPDELAEILMTCLKKEQNYATVIA